MDQLTQDFAGDDDLPPPQAPEESRLRRALPSLVGAIVCTALIVEAIWTAIGARANGDAMVMVCPILGAVFLTIPAGQAWWSAFKILFRSDITSQSAEPLPGNPYRPGR